MPTRPHGQLDVKVAQVSALQQAATRLRETAQSCNKQLAQLRERETLKLSDFRSEQLQTSIKKLVGMEQRAAASAKTLISRFDSIRDRSIEDFVPMLMMTVEKYSQVYNAMLGQDEEESLERLGELCRGITTKGRQLRQIMPSAAPATDPDTLMRLLALAIQAQERLQDICNDAAKLVPDAEVVIPPHPIKGVKRCLQKVQEEYEVRSSPRLAPRMPRYAAVLASAALLAQLLWLGARML